MTAAAQILRKCNICDKMIPKRPNESWGVYNLKNGCTPSHAAKYRQHRDRIAIQGPLNLSAAMRGWSVAA